MKERKAELQKLIDFKKLKGANRKPRYATRKLSIGLVSCMLGFVLLVSPQSVEASEVADAPAAVESTTEGIDTSKEAEPAKVEAPVEEKNKEQEAPVENKGTEAPKKEEKPEVAPEAQPTAVKEAKAPAKTEEKPAEEKSADKNADEKAKAEKELADYKDQATQKIEKAFENVDAKNASKTLEAYKEEVANAESKEAIDKIVKDAEAEPKLEKEEATKDKKEVAKSEEFEKFTAEEKAKLVKAGVSEERIENLEKSYNAFKDTYKREDFIAASILV